MYISHNTHSSLDRFVRKTDLTWQFRLKIALGISSGMHFLHSASPPIVHRDLKSPNILMCSNDPNFPIVAKVSDFGLSTMNIPGLKFDRDILNPCWLAPECMAKKQTFAPMSDVYSFGIIMWELIVGQHPFDEFNIKFSSALEDKIKAGLRPTLPVDCPDQVTQLVVKCWEGSAEKRPTFGEIEKELQVLLEEFSAKKLLQ